MILLLSIDNYFNYIVFFLFVYFNYLLIDENYTNMMTRQQKSIELYISNEEVVSLLNGERFLPLLLLWKYYET